MRQWFVLALLLGGAATGADAAAGAATKTALVSPTMNTAEEKRQLEELRDWVTKAGQCPGLESCDDLGCSCKMRAKDYVAPKSDGPVSWLVLFCVEWAERCRKFSKVLDEIAPDLRGLYKIGYVDAEEKPELALKQLGIHVYPTLLAFPRGFGGGHRPLEYDRPKGSPGKVASWALGQLPNMATQVFTSDDVFRATSSKHVAVVLFNDKSVTPAGFKAAALRHAHALAHSNSKHLRFAEVRREQYAQTANGQDGTDLGDFVRKFGPGMDQRQWPQIVILQKKKPNTSSNVVTWEQTKYSIERFTITQINDKKASFYAAEFEKALQATVVAIAQPHSSGSGTAAQSKGTTGGYQLPAPGSARAKTEAATKPAAATPKTQPSSPVDRIPAHINNPPPSPPPPPPPPPQSPPPTQPRTSTSHKIDGYSLTDSPIPALIDGLFVASGEYNGRSIYRRVPEEGAKAQQHLPALYWHSKHSMWVFHAAFSEAAGEHGLGHAQFKTDGTSGLGVEPPVGLQRWNCWLNAKWRDCDFKVTAMHNLASPPPPTPMSMPAPAPTSTRRAAEGAQKDEIERVYQRQKAAADAVAKRKHAEAAAAASKILEHRKVEDNIAEGTSFGANVATGDGFGQEQEELVSSPRESQPIDNTLSMLAWSDVPNLLPQGRHQRPLSLKLLDCVGPDLGRIWRQRSRH
eukprot:COSAG02_NODE_6097_length_3802_cov_2.381853_1_plen_687_part_00